MFSNSQLDGQRSQQTYENSFGSIGLSLATISLVSTMMLFGFLYQGVSTGWMFWILWLYLVSSSIAAVVGIALLLMGKASE